MARDPQTLPLLEVSQQQRQRFQEQAQRCPIPFLYKALKVMNQCDISYKQSSNKRLLVELTLIQVAQITQPDDDSASAGRSPKRLKSLFKKLTSAPQPKPAAQVAGVGAIPATRSRAKQEQDANTKREITVQTPATLAPAPKMKLGSILMTFDSLKPKEQTTPLEEKEPENTPSAEQSRFTEDDLRLQWMQMCNRMPQSMVGMASRMKNITPRITEYPNIEVVVDNQILLDQIQGIKRKIRATLVRDLHNSNIQVECRLAEGHEFKKALTKRELFDELRKKNSAIEKLRSVMNLELT